jgi:hypothetical protein
MVLYGFGYLASLKYNTFYFPIGFNSHAESEIPILFYGAYFVFYFGIFLFGFWLWYSRNNKQEIVTIIGNPVIVLLIAGYIFFFLWLYPHKCVIWDEISFWIRKPLTFYHFGTFEVLGRRGNINYPPGLGLFQYYFCRILGYSEGYVIIATALAQFSCMLVILRNMTWKRWKLISIVIATLMLLTWTFQFGLQSIYVESPLSVFFAASLFCYFALAREKETIFKRLFPLIPGLFALTLIKEVGWHLTLVVIGIVITDLIVELFLSFRNNAVENKNETKSTTSVGRKVTIGILLILLFLSPYIAHSSWEFRISSLNIPNAVSTNNLFKRPQEIFSEMCRTVPLHEWCLILCNKNKYKEVQTAWRESVTEKERVNFHAARKAFLSRPVYGSTLVLSQILVLLTAGSFVLPFCPSAKGMRLRYFILALLILLGYFAFVFGVTCNNVFSFDLYTGSRAQCFERFCGTFLQGWAMLLLCIACQNHCFAEDRFSPENYNRRNIVWCIVLLIVFTTLATTNMKRFIKYSTESNIPVREKTAKIVSELFPTVPLDANVRIIWQNTSGLEHRILNLDVFPRKIQSAAWNIGTPHYDGDIWTSNISVERFAKELEECTHLFLAHPDKQFWETYGELFDIIPENKETPRVYRIEKNNTGFIKLIQENESKTF